MQRLLISTAMLGMALLAGAPAQAQTTIKITMPDTSSCVYPTGPVSSNSTAGQLQATATAAGTGAGCTPPVGTGAVSFGPASPLSPANGPALQSSPTGESTTLTFQAVNATSCTGQITGAAGGTFTTPSPFCSGATGAGSCANAQSIGVSLPYNSDPASQKIYTVAVTCSAGIQTAVSTATVTVDKKDVVQTGACPKVVPSSTAGITSFLSATTVGITFLGCQTCVNGTKDPSDFRNVFVDSWPGRFGLANQVSLPKSKYMSMGFTVPDNYMPSAPANLYGLYTIGETGFAQGAATSITISKECGDFAPPASGSSVVPGCYKNKLTADQYLAYVKSGSCQLTAGAYFLNVINADISNLTPSGGSAASTAGPQCPSGNCIVPLQLGGNWQNYVPPN